ncbi:MAG TPA: ATP-dependent DNA helicase RecQ [Polyangiaceae bacterium]|nr:ATP-dependent DNA helicase RecQ [Polyangiaceae bacterium]
MSVFQPTRDPPPRGAQAARAALTEVFALREFRPWQWDAVTALLEGPGRVLVVAPTGGGKSLTYQLPAVVLPGTTLVISPLVALMEDQVRGLAARGIAATFIASTLEVDERRRREEGLSRGDYKLVFVAPERLGSGAFLARLARADIALVAIDEAHCIAQWGHDFRPDYLRIGELLRVLAPPRVLACTATATLAVRREIVARLGLDQGPGYEEILRGFARPNLHLTACPVDGPKQARELAVDALTRALGARGAAPAGGAIVYAATRRAAESWTEVAKQLGYRCATYHAGLDGDVRARVSAAFSARELDVVVATNAFGMGIDRPDIRLVVHVQPPGSVEAYYQEVGRAGRDGDEAHGLLLCSSADIAVRRRLAALDAGGAEADSELAGRAWSQFRAVLTYLDAGSCRHDFILRHFGDERETLGGCGHCDVCERLDALADRGPSDGPTETEASLAVRKALSGVARAKQRAGLTAVAAMLAGKVDARVQRFGFDRLSTFGLLKGEGEPWALALLRALLAAGYIDLTPTEHPVPRITREGWEVLKSQEPVRVLLPPRGVEARRGPGRPRAPRAEIAIDDGDRACFERLRAVRAELARERRVPAYVVAPDRALAEVSRVRPRSLAELGAVSGFGPSRLEAYGDAVLRAVGEPDA